MKNIILTILRTGYTTTQKYSVDDLVKFFYPLKYILKKESEKGTMFSIINRFENGDGYGITKEE